MKTSLQFFILFVFLFFNIGIKAQNRITDTSATSIAYWKKGDTRIYQITHRKEKTEAGKLKSSNEGIYDAHLKVTESSNTSYTIEWTYSNFKMAGPGQHAINSLMTIMNGLKIIYKTDDVGNFAELLNWKEIRDFSFENYEKATAGKLNDHEFVAALNQVKSIFSTRENIETALIQEVQIFHSAYGVEYGITGSPIETELPNITGGAPFPATIILKLDSLNKAEDRFVVSLNQTIDKGKAGPILAAVLKKLSSTPIQEEEIKKEITDLEISDINQFSFSISTGWIKTIKYIRTSNVGNLKQVETYLINEIK